jgi:phospholipid/cholesterol/gamma-HCH transport system substrate-binding protein
MKSIATETKVGIFVVLGILVLAFFTIKVGRIEVGREKGYEVYTLLDSASGLAKNSPVQIAGVEVGKVESISLEGSRARVTLQLSTRVRIPEGSKINVKSVGLLGEKYLEIVPPPEGKTTKTGQNSSGQSDQGQNPEGISASASAAGMAYAAGRSKFENEKEQAGYIKPGGYIEQGGPSVDVDRVLTQLSTIGSDIQVVTKSLSGALGGPEGEKAIREIVSGARETVANLQEIAETIERGEGTLGKLVKDEKLYGDVKETMANLKEVTQSIEEGKGTLGKLVKDEALYAETKATMVEAREMMGNLKKVSDQIEKGEGTLGKLVKDDALYVQTKETMEEAKQALASISKVSQQIESGEGTLGKLVKDDTLYVKATETMDAARETMANLNKVSGQLEKGEGTLGKLVNDDSLYEDTRRAIKSVQKAADGVSEVTPVTVLGVILGNVIR